MANLASVPKKLSRENFDYLSHRIEEIVLGFFDKNPNMEDWLSSVAIFGWDLPDHYVDGRQADIFHKEIILARGPSAGVVSVAPWTKEPHNRISAATAHDCASRFIRTVCEVIFPSRPNFRDLKNDITPWIKKSMAGASKRMTALAKQTDYSAIMELAAKVEQERIQIADGRKPERIKGKPGRPKANEDEDSVCRPARVVASPGRPTETKDIGKFAYEQHQQGMPWKNMRESWKRLHPNDSRNEKLTEGSIRAAYYRYCADTQED